MTIESELIPNRQKMQVGMHLLSLPSATVLGLVASTHLVVGAALQRRDTNNQINLYGDPYCRDASSYIGTWAGPGPGNNENPAIETPLFVGGVLIMNGDHMFDSLQVNGQDFVLGNGLCPGVSQQPAPGWPDASGNACYTVNKTVRSAEMFTQTCASSPPDM
ncbi:hypothetical protein V8E54_004293 [Elaphomyces granulatus]